MAARLSSKAAWASPSPEAGASQGAGSTQCGGQAVEQRRDPIV